MRSLLIFVVFCIPFMGFSQVKNAGCILRMANSEDKDLSLVNDSVNISFTFNSMNYFCKVSIQNKTNEVISVDWDKFVMIMEGKSYPIIFENTVMIKKDDPKGSTNIAPGTSLEKHIAPTDYIELELSLYNKGRVKRHGDQEIGYIIPLLFDNDLKYYDCKISVSLK